MAVSQLVASFKTSLDESPESLVARAESAFAGKRAILQDITASWGGLGGGANGAGTGGSNGGLVVRILYLDSTGTDRVGHVLKFALYTTDIVAGGSTAQEKFNDAFAAGTFERVPLRVLDITNPAGARSGVESLLAVFACTECDADAAGIGTMGDDVGPFVADPFKFIPAGGQDDAEILDTEAVQVDPVYDIFNAGTDLWAGGDRSFAIYDMTTGEYIGCAACCGSDLLDVQDYPTTTSPPVPCVSEEVPSVTPAAGTDTITTAAP